MPDGARDEFSDEMAIALEEALGLDQVVKPANVVLDEVLAHAGQVGRPRRATLAARAVDLVRPLALLQLLDGVAHGRQALFEIGREHRALFDVDHGVRKGVVEPELRPF